MLKTIKTLIIGMSVAAAGLAVAPSDAKAGDYCREYTRTVYIGNRTQEAYGTACLQPNGDWMIVGENARNDIPDYASNVDYVIRDNNRYIEPQRVVYYDQRPIYRRNYAPAPLFVWYHNGHYRGSKHYKYDNRRYGWNGHNHDRWDRDDHRGRGRGRGHGRD